MTKAELLEALYVADHWMGRVPVSLREQDEYGRDRLHVNRVMEAAERDGGNDADADS